MRERTCRSTARPGRGDREAGHPAVGRIGDPGHVAEYLRARRRPWSSTGAAPTRGRPVRRGSASPAAPHPTVPTPARGSASRPPAGAVAGAAGSRPGAAGRPAPPRPVTTARPARRRWARIWPGRVHRGWVSRDVGLSVREGAVMGPVYLVLLTNAPVGALCRRLRALGMVGSISGFGIRHTQVYGIYRF